MRKLIAGLLMFGAASTFTLNAQANDIAGAQAVIDGQIKAFRAGENVEAFSYAAPNLQVMFRNHQNFIAMVKRGYGAIYEAQSWTFGRNRMEDGTLYQEMLITGPKGRGWGALYSLRQEADGTWRIHGVQLDKSALQST